MRILIKILEIGNLTNRASKFQLIFIVVLLLIFNTSNLLPQQNRLSTDSILNKSQISKITYRNPRVYNVDYTFELHPDPNKIDKETDLKLWIPVPREWDSQKAVKIISVEPKPHATFKDPEYGNKIYYWDFGKESTKDSNVVDIKYRLETFEIHAQVDPNNIGEYDKTNRDYILNTRSTHTLDITPEVNELAENIVGDETNPYLKAKKIFDFVRKKMRFNINVRQTRGSGINSILEYPQTDPLTGEKYYEGQCDHFSVLFITLCRAAGIPARGVLGMVGWNPWMTESQLKLRDKRHTELSPNGLAAARLYGPFNGHIWAEFYIPRYGWIPADPTWGRFGSQVNYKFILTKGHDIMIVPYAPRKESKGYGDQWIPLFEGRANVIGFAVWNIARIRVAKAKFLHTSDPFPADGLNEYATNLYPESEAEEKLKNWKKEQMLLFYNTARQTPNVTNIFEANPKLNTNRDAYICHLLRQTTGDEKFQKIFRKYLNSRLTSGMPVSTEKFQKIAEQIYGAPLGFFFKEWIDSKALPQFRLDNVRLEKEKNDWQIDGNIIQEGKTFNIPIEFAFRTQNGQERRKIWLDSNKTDFEFLIKSKPKKLIVDPDFNIPTVRWMPPVLQMLWDSYPNLTVIYGTLAETKANKAAAIRFVEYFAGLNREIIKADTDVNEEDLKAQRIILFGRPETNKITQRFQNNFPVTFEKDKFTWQGSTFDQPTQGVAQVIENPLNSKSMIILYAGLSGDATQQICDNSKWPEELNGSLLIDLNASYIIFDNYKKLISGNWEDFNSSLVWNFE